MLERDRFIARLDAKLHRKEGLLEVKGLWWEPSARVTAGREEALQQAILKLADWLGARLG